MPCGARLLALVDLCTRCSLCAMLLPIGVQGSDQDAGVGGGGAAAPALKRPAFKKDVGSVKQPAQDLLRSIIIQIS